MLKKCDIFSLLQEQANAWLSHTIATLNNTKQQLTGKTSNELLDDEKGALGAAPERLLCYEQVPLRVDKYATVSYKTNRYSVPDHLVGAFVDAKIMSHNLWFYHDNRKVAMHQRR
ncbi:hypothetical protein SAMN04487911_10869 [Arenibacter nanhaiticus]|uniref:Transposase for insertion sequence element IS21-like C-terminal domain-containing protein n=1 Tax=Arenibacter nanhaiticus TaxID=558155 RepID=A0A1M6FBZ2_9FLAO|nr:hypothetical protein [Arenibacter nanhaiticus]SHI95129.1 hypothetical protein SAMN04487911_10869 [Arenibacter nanhaiticus]